jgi:hypothetical protein
VVETETPFKYIFLGTEPVLATETPEASETELLTDIPFDSLTQGSTVFAPTSGTPALGTPTLATPNNTAPSITGTSRPILSSSPLHLGTAWINSFDDVDARLVYNGGGDVQESAL